MKAIYDRKEAAPTDAEQSPRPEVKDIRTEARKDDRSAHRAHAWLYEDLLA
jgi:hypothetical protein